MATKVDGDAAQDACAAQATAPPREFGDILLMPIKVKTSNNSKVVEKKLNYLWQTAYKMLFTCPAIAHEMT